MRNWAAIVVAGWLFVAVVWLGLLVAQARFEICRAAGQPVIVCVLVAGSR